MNKEKEIVKHFRQSNDYKELFVAYEQEVIKCEEWINKCDDLQQKLQFKDKMIELMARKLAKGGVPRFYQENRVIKDTALQALAELRGKQ